MKKALLTLVASTLALSSAVSCTDYLYEGKVDLTQKEFDYPALDEYTFNHPCALVTENDITRVKERIEAADANDPVYAAWLNFCDNQYAQPTHQPAPVETLVRGDASGTGTTQNYMNAARDAAAAFQLAVRWRLTDDTQYADAAVRILNAWPPVCKRITSNDADFNLAAGFQGYTFANAAELLRDYEGWADEDQQAFKKWMTELWLDINYGFISNHGSSTTCNLHYWPNWELANLASILSIAIYTENREMVDFVHRNFREGAGSGAIGNMIPYEPVADPDVEGCLIAQNRESGRDQGHATLVISVCAELCQIAWNAGMDFFGMDDNKILAMAEYTAKYNAMPNGNYIPMSTAMPFTYLGYCLPGCGCTDTNHGAEHTEVSEDGRGTERPCWDLIYTHYSKVKHLPEARTHYTKLFGDQLRYTDGVLTGDGGAGDSRYGSNSSAFDQIGWGTLLFYQDYE